jgi:hypothetical protein
MSQMGVNGTASRRQARMKGQFRSGSLEFAAIKGSLNSLDFRTFLRGYSFKHCLSAAVLLNRRRHFWSQIKIQTTIKMQKTVSGQLAIKLPQAGRLRCLFLESGVNERTSQSPSKLDA